jgi:hypothetical protein
MPIPDERLPDIEDAEEGDAMSSSAPAEMLDEQDELEFESSDADESDDAMLEPDEEEDNAGFGFGDPAD